MLYLKTSRWVKKMGKYISIGIVSMGLFAVLVGLLPACATKEDARFRQNRGDSIALRLHVGMSSDAVDAIINEQREYLFEDHFRKIESEDDLYNLYSDNYYPMDILKTVDIGTPYRLIAYWTNYAGRNAGTLLLFFDGTTKQLRGWVNTASALSRDRFMHERLTSKLELSSSIKDRMTRAQVHALLGAPTEIISGPQKKSRELYDDHFWIAFYPFVHQNDKVEGYTYLLPSGAKRRVYVVFYPAGDVLKTFGYDHAWQEAERYLRERGVQQK